MCLEVRIILIPHLELTLIEIDNSDIANILKSSFQKDSPLISICLSTLTTVLHMECGHGPMTNVNKELVIDQATVVWTLDNTICWIALYPVDNTIHFAITYPLDSDLSIG